MGLELLTFTTSGSSEQILDPVTLTESQVFTFTVNNFSEESFSDLGIFAVPSTIVGPVTHPADYPPETDYQDLIRWGEATEQGLAVSGGLRLSIPQNEGDDLVAYITRQQGSTLANKLPMRDLAPDSSVDIGVEMQTPPGVTARRLYISLRVDESP